jgi:hypothetical protein
MPMLVENVVVTILGNVILEETKAVTVNRANIHRPKAIEECGALSLLYTLQDSILELKRGALGECKGYNRVRRHTFVDKAGNSLRDCFRLA